MADKEVDGELDGVGVATRLPVVGAPMAYDCEMLDREKNEVAAASMIMFWRRRQGWIAFQLQNAEAQ